MGQEYKKKAEPAKQEEVETEELEAKDQAELTEDVDGLLDEIDGVLEENAEQFVAEYVQKGGE